MIHDTIVALAVLGVVGQVMVGLLILIAAYHGDDRFARYLLVLPVVGAGVSTYHLLVENGVMTIPTLALTAFLLLIAFLSLAAASGGEEAATLPAHA